MVNVITEGKHAGEYILTEVGMISRDKVTLAAVASLSLVAGTVLGKLDAGGKYKQHAPGASDGTQHAVAILFDNVASDNADVEVAISARLTEVVGAQLTWPGGITDNQKTTAIAKLEADGRNIIVR